MSVGRAIKRKVKAALPPLVFLLLVAYFCWNAVRGDLGLEAYARRQQDLVTAQAGLAAAQNDLARWDRRVSALRANHLDPDALDERARAMLNLADPTDIVVPYGQKERLF
jgi:cell division protein FtsB